MSNSRRKPQQPPFRELVRALAGCGTVVLAFNPNTGHVEARLEPSSNADGDHSDRHIGVAGATRG